MTLTEPTFLTRYQQNDSAGAPCLGYLLLSKCCSSRIDVTDDIMHSVEWWVQRLLIGYRHRGTFIPKESGSDEA